LRPLIVSPTDGVGESWYRDAGIEVRIVELPNCRNVLQGWSSSADYETSVRRIMSVIQETQPDVVVANTLNSFYIVDAASRVGKPSVWIIHESYGEAQMRRSINGFAFRNCEEAFGKAYRVVFVSTDTMRLYERYNRHHNFVAVPNGLDARRIDEYIRQVSKAEAAQLIEAPPGKKIITMVGTICQRKDQATLAQAVALIKKERDDFCCYMVGLRDSLSYAGQVKRIITEHNLGEVVKLISETDDVYAYYRASDIFAFTSHVEAFSLAILEAEAFGLPIVTTACCGIHEQVRAEVNAHVIHSSDVAALARHLTELLEDEQTRHWMGRNSREVFDYLVNHDEMIERYERLVLGARMGGALTREEQPRGGNG
jgi:glycosyltransferase involved in cell wall biosynthesis